MNMALARKLLSYDPITGIFTWKISRPGVKVNSQAGSIQSNGYRYILLLGITYRASRLAWQFYYKEIPPERIDHKNRKKADDRISNLRTATRQQNSANCEKELRGVYKHGNKFKAQLKFDKKTVYFGLYSTKEEAYEVIVKKHKEFYGEFSPCV